MPFPSGTFLNEIRAWAGVVASEFDHLYAQLEGWLRKEHKEDGSHGNVTADSLTATKNTATGATGNVTATGTTHTFGAGAVINSAAGNALLQLGATGLTVAARTAYAIEFSPSISGLLVGASGTNSFKIYDEEHDRQFPVFELGVSSGESLYQLRGGTANGMKVSIGTIADSLSDQSIIYVSTAAGYYERARQTPMGEWQAFTYAAGNFTASAGSWTVDSGDVVVNRYMLIGKTLFWDLEVQTSDVSSAGAFLRATLPASLTSGAARTSQFIRTSDAGGAAAIGVALYGGTTYVEFRSTVAGAGYALTAADNTLIQASLVIEVT